MRSPHGLVAIVLAASGAAAAQAGEPELADARRFVVSEAQIEERIYLDEGSVGAAEASLGMLSMSPAASTRHPAPDGSTEILYALEGSGEVGDGLLRVSFGPGDVVVVPEGAGREVRAGGQGARLVVVTVPTTGGARQAARRVAPAGTLCVRPIASAPVRTSKDGSRYVFLARGIETRDAVIELLLVTIPAGSPADSHAHDDVSELIYVVRGQGTAVIGGGEHRLDAGAAFYTPMGFEAGIRTDTEMEILVVVVEPRREAPPSSR